MSRSLLKSTTSCPTDPATTLASVNGSRGHSTSPAWCLCIQNPPLPILSFHVFSNRRHVLDIASLAGCLPNALLSSHQHAQFVIWLGVKHSAVVLSFFLQGPLHHLPFAWIPSLRPKVLPLPPRSLHQVTFSCPCTSNKEDGLIANANAERRLPERACLRSSPPSYSTPSHRSTPTRTSWRTRISSLS